MSMREALAAIAGKAPWLGRKEQDTPVEPPTPVDEAEALVTLAKGHGRIDNESATWSAVSAWAAAEIINAHRAMEMGNAEYLRARCMVLRELLALPQRTVQQRNLVEDQAPLMP